MRLANLFVALIICILILEAVDAKVKKSRGGGKHFKKTQRKGKSGTRKPVKSTSTNNGGSSNTNGQTDQDDSSSAIADSISSLADVLGDSMSKYAPGAGATEEKSKEALEKIMESVNEDTGSIASENLLKKVMVEQGQQSESLDGPSTISVQADQGFNGFANFKPSGWKTTETMEPAVDASTSDDEEEMEKETVFTYPNGVGPALIGGCTGSKYAEDSPCYGTKQAASGRIACLKLMESASYIGVGFDGRGYYKIDSRKASLVQRRCSKGATYKGKDVPDTMAVFGIYDTKAETKTFTSSGQYMRYIRKKAGVTNQKNTLKSEYNYQSSGSSSTFSGGKTTSTSTSTTKSRNESSSLKTDAQSTKQGSLKNFFSILFINVIHYEISLDEVKPEDLNFAVLKDYLSLPESYYSVGADVKYQNFILRWGTHYIRSAKFGGQLKIVKRARADKSMSSEQFSSIAETEFQSMFTTLTTKTTSVTRRTGFWGLGGKETKTTSSTSSKSERNSEKKMEENNRVSKKFRQSEFTHTTVEAQGGTPLISEALLDFYTPAFKEIYWKWIASIKNYVKPFEFKLKSIGNLFNMNMDSLFPSGSTNFACMKGAKARVKIMTENVTNKRFYYDKRVIIWNNRTNVTEKKVYCKYDSFDSFKMSLQRHRAALEMAVSVYMAVGSVSTTSDELDAGEAGCEEATRARLDIFESGTSQLMYRELKSGNPFLISFDLPASLPGIAAAKGKYVLVFKVNRWFATEPRSRLIHLYSGCRLPQQVNSGHKVCFKNIILTYEERFGMFVVKVQDFYLSKQKLPNLPDWLIGKFVARASPLPGTRGSSIKSSIPCNIRWQNSHRLDRNAPTNCLHFTAASEGHIFVVFSSIPKDKNTWYYLVIGPHGVHFYRAMRLEKSENIRGIGNLGDKNFLENFFVCVIQYERRVIMQYGKVDPESDAVNVYSSHKFSQDSQYNRLSFYAFGAGIKAVSLMDIRLIRKMPEVMCLNSKEKFIEVHNIGHCTLDCHSECEGCEFARNNKACVKCRNVEVKLDTGVQCFQMCPPGYILSGNSTVKCIKCEAGTFKANSGNKNCTACSPGFYSFPGAASCSRCRPGTYTDQIGSKKCKLCPRGTSTNGLFGARNCSICYPGTYTPWVGGEKCKGCPKGTSSNTYGSKLCEMCRPGTYTDQIGSKECKVCPNGTHTDNVYESKSCIPCNPGSFAAEPESGLCSDCPIGTDTRGLHGSASCSPCAPGTFASNTGTESCYPCPEGMYTPYAKSTRCFKCPNDPRKSTGATTCTKCPPGMYGSEYGTTSCMACAGIGYQPYKATSFCFLCKQKWKGFEKPATKCVRCTAEENEKYSHVHGEICSGMQTDEHIQENEWYVENE